ncbi:MAG: aldehyde dehydrogenase family protein, partial [Thermoplasmata archaeon]|nr:aldehyde dehydrogenase family protein [Thermoplasmata archaeon]
LWMAPLAIVCGNSFILKPSERVPFSSDRLARCFLEAGVPDGVFNLIHGGKEAVDALLVHPGVDAVAFVGSAPVALHVYASAAAQGKRVLALAGAKNHIVVMPDADLERSVPAIVSSAFGSAGERCLAGSVVVAVEPVGDVLVKALGERVQALKVGDGALDGTEMGPVIRAEHRDRIAGWVEQGLQEGAVLAAQGKAPTAGGGYFSPPTLFDRVRPTMAIAQEEVFGPVLCVVRVRSLEEAIEVANRSRFGNAAAIFTQDGRAAREFAHRVEAGMVGVNIGVPAPAAFFPFVGWRGSVYGDLAVTGREAVQFYSRTKVVTRRWF